MLRSSTCGRQRAGTPMKGNGGGRATSLRNNRNRPSGFSRRHRTDWDARPSSAAGEQAASDRRHTARCVITRQAVSSCAKSWNAAQGPPCRVYKENDPLNGCQVVGSTLAPLGSLCFVLSRTSRILRAKVSGVNGFCRNAIVNQLGLGRPPNETADSTSRPHGSNARAAARAWVATNSATGCERCG